MQLKLETIALDDRETETKAVVRPEPASDRDSALVGTAVPIMVVAYGTALGIVTYTFWHSGDTLLSIAICSVYIVMFFGVPILMARIRNRHDARWDHGCREATADRVDVFRGSIGRREAPLQMVIVPVALVLAFAVIWLSIKP